MKLNIPLLISCSSILYINLLPLSPVYILLLASFVLFLYNGINKDDFRNNLLLLIFFIFYFFIQLIMSAKISVFFNTFLMFFTFSILYSSLCQYNSGSIKNIAYKFVVFSAIILGLETLYRFSFPIYLNDIYLNGLELYLYPFKRNSPMFVDSNYTCIVAINSLMLFNFGIISIKDNKILYLIIMLLLILTFSRAAIIGYILTSTIFFFLDFEKNKVKSSITVIVFLIAIIGFIVYGESINLFSSFSDGSFLSKFKLLNMMYNNFKELDVSFLLFSSGLGNSGYILEGMGAHNILVLLYTEYGVVFSIFLFSFIIFTTVKTKGKALSFWVMMFIIGMSLGFFLSFVLVPMAFLMAYKYVNVNKVYKR